MAAPIVGPVDIGKGGLTVVFSPPLEFIMAQVGAIGAELLDLGGLWDRVEPVMAEIEREQFETAGHGQWPPLAASTLAWKEKHGYPADPLVRTGKMKEQLTTPSLAADRGVNQMSWGTSVDYAEHHQEPSVPGRPPQRKVIDIRVGDRFMIEAAMIRWINVSVAKHWGV